MKNLSKKRNKAFAATVSAILLATVMSCSAFSLSASAEDDVANFKYDARTVTKLLDKKNTTYAPDTSFDFVISTENNTALHTTTVGTTSINWKWGGSGENALISFSDTQKGLFTDSVEFYPNDSDIGKTQLSDTASIYINTDLLRPGTSLTPGVYRYQITENINAYEGITYFITSDSTAPNFVQDTTTQIRYIYLYVTYIDANDTSKGLKIINTTISHETADGNEVKSDLNWRNEYYSKTYGFHLKKQVSGNAGDQTKPFSFTIKVKSSSSNNEQWRATLPDGTAIILKSDEEQTVALKHNQEITIWGLTQTDEVTITENDYSSDGYTTSYQPDEYFTDTSNADAKLTFTGNLKNPPAVNNLNGYVYFTNTNNVTVPTGLVREYAPYAALVVIASAAGIAYYQVSRKGRED